MDFIADNLAALRPLATDHVTEGGVRCGFFMADATQALGSLAKASAALAVLLTEGLVASEPVVIGGEVHTLYRLTAAPTPRVH